MEGIEPRKERAEKPKSLVEQKRQEAFSSVCQSLNERVTTNIGKTFEVAGRTYELTNVEDCMVAYAQILRQEVTSLHEVVKNRDDYYEEKATAKLLELFRAYERTVTLFAELKSYYPTAAAQVEDYIPALTACDTHAATLWKQNNSEHS